MRGAEEDQSRRTGVEVCGGDGAAWLRIVSNEGASVVEVMLCGARQV